MRNEKRQDTQLKTMYSAHFLNEISDPISQDHLNVMLILLSGDPAVGLKRILGVLSFLISVSSLSAVHPQRFGSQKCPGDRGQRDENR